MSSYSPDKRISEFAANACWSWCYYCGHTVSVGCHHPNGDFDQYSVMVTESEVQCAINTHPWLKDRTKTRYNIALGKHAGVYPK